MGGKHIASVVSLALNLCNDVEALVILQKLILDIKLNALGRSRQSRCCSPKHRLFDNSLAVSLVELQGLVPSVYQTSHRRSLLAALQTSEIGRVLVGEPEITHHKCVFVFGTCEVGKNLV